MNPLSPPLPPRCRARWATTTPWLCPGPRTSQVGLYLGKGKFIHSARGGVQISVLSPDDISGRWWFQRWRGARRVVA